VYLPRQFVAPPERLAAFLALPRLAELVTRSSAGLTASSLPLLYEPREGAPGSFVGHLARANAQWSDLADDEALVIIGGPDAYVSPIEYPSRLATGEVVPTWNYLSVQGHGRLVVHDDPAWTRALVTRLTDLAEAPRSERWAVADAPADYIDAQLQAIVGFEVLLDRLEGNWKLSQNRRPEDRRGVLDAFAAGDPREREVAEEMRWNG